MSQIDFKKYSDEDLLGLLEVTKPDLSQIPTETLQGHF